MASSPSSADSGYVTGGTESRGGHVHRDIDGLSSDSTKDIASWIRPTIRKLCNKLGAPAAVPHILAGVTTILTQPSPPSNNDRANQEEEKKDKIQALIAAVYLYVRTRLSQCDTSGAEYVSQRKEILSTLAHLREDEKVEWEGWEKVIPNDVDTWLMEINKRGWLKLGWFEDVYEGARLEVKDGNGQPERLAEEQERVEEEHSLAEKQRLAQKQERLRLGQEKKRLAKEQRLAQEKERLRLKEEQMLAEKQKRLIDEQTLAKEQERLRLEEEQRLAEKQKKLIDEQTLAKEQERLRLEKEQRLAEKQKKLAEEQTLAKQQERLRLEEEQRIAEEQKRLRVAEERRLAEERGRAEKQRVKLVEEQEKLAQEQRLAMEQERLRLARKQKLAEEQDRLAEEQKLADEQERQRVAKEEKLAEERRLAEERERKIFAEEQSLADEQESPAEEHSPVEEQEMLSEEQGMLVEEQSPVEEHRLAEELNSYLKRKHDADAAASPSRYQKKRKIDNAEDIEDDIHEQELYRIENPGEKVLRVIPIAGGKPWNSLERKESATVDNWTFNIGDLVYVRIAGNPDGLAKVSEIIELEPEYDAVVLAWYYTRHGIEGELGGPRKITKNRQTHLDSHWAPDAPFTWMLSSNRTINMANTLRGKASLEVMAKVCLDKFYVTTDNPNNPIRKICNARRRDYKWMRKLLQMEAKTGVDARSDNCLIPGADAMSDIQPSATPEPQNPTLCMSPPMIPPLPPSEETLANADAESPTVSTTLNQTTIESSSAASIVTEAAQYDIELSELSGNILFLKYMDDLAKECSNTPTSDDWLASDADATTQMPWTPCNVSKETPARAGGEPSACSTFDQATIDSSSITSPIITVAPHDIEMSDGVHRGEESGTFADKPMEPPFEPWARDFNWNNWCGNDIFNPEYPDFGGFQSDDQL